MSNRRAYRGKNAGLLVMTSPAKRTCPECEVTADHTWRCGSAPEVLPDGARPYYWRD